MKFSVTQGPVAAGLTGHAAIDDGVRYLIEHQNSDGSWSETEFTGTGFPKVFYLRYHYYRIYFPMLALSKWAMSSAAAWTEIPAPKLGVVTADDEEEEVREREWVGVTG